MAKEKLTEIKQIGPLSTATMASLMYGFFGLVSSVLILILKMFGSDILEKAGLDAITIQNFGPLQACLSIVSGLIAGFLTGILIALFYNLIARFIGGIKVKI